MAGSAEKLQNDQVRFLFGRARLGNEWSADEEWMGRQFDNARLLIFLGYAPSESRRFVSADTASVQARRRTYNGQANEQRTVEPRIIISEGCPPNALKESQVVELS